MKNIIHGYTSGFIDFPNKFSATLFFPGCNFKCFYCHNKGVCEGEGEYSLIDISNKIMGINNSFASNIGVVLSGGEPSIHSSFRKVVDAFKGKYPLSVHTNGTKLLGCENPFTSVILSLKTPVDAQLKTETYIKRMNAALKYYSSCEQKELRIVDIQAYKPTYGKLLSELNTEGYRINYVTPI